jgi:hypothetical protein
MSLEDVPYDLRRQVQDELLTKMQAQGVDIGDVIGTHPDDYTKHGFMPSEQGRPYPRNIGIDLTTGEPQLLDVGGMATVPGTPTQQTPMKQGTWLERALFGKGLQSDYRNYLEEQGARGMWPGASEAETEFQKSPAQPGSTALAPAPEPFGPPTGPQTKVGGLAKEARGGRHVGTWTEERGPMRHEAVDDLVQKTQDAMQRPPGGAGELLNTMEGMSQPELRRALEAMGVDVKAALKGTVGDEKWDALYQAFHDIVLQGRRRLATRFMGLR